MKKIFFLSLTSLLLCSVNAEAAKRYWVATATSDWNNTANWAATNGGAGGQSVPSTNDTAYFTSAATAQCNLNMNASIKRMEMGASCGTFAQGTYALTLGTTGGLFSGGTFSGGSGSITSSGTVTVSGCAFTSTSGLFTANSDFTFSSGSFAHNSGSLKFTASNTISGSINCYNLEFAPASNSIFVIASGTTLTVTATLTLSGSSEIVINTGAIHAKGNIVLSNTYSSNTAGGSASLVINGTADQTINGNGTEGNSRLPHVTINKSSDTLFLEDTISIQGNFVYTSGIVHAGTSTVHFTGSKTITGSLSLYTISFGGSSNFTYTISTGTVLTADGNLVTGGASSIVIDSGDIHVHRNITIGNSGTAGGGNATITINDTLNQLFSTTVAAGRGRLPNIVIDKTGNGSLSLSGIISCAGNWTYIQGNVLSGTSAVVFYGNFTLDGQGTSGTMAFYRVQVANGTRTLAGDLDCNDNLAFATGTTLSAGTYDLFVGGNWNGQGTWSHGDNTVTFDGGGYNRIQGPSGLGVNFTDVVLDRRSGSLTCVNPVTVDSSMTFMLGRFKTTAINYLQFGNDAQCIMMNDDSAYVHGPVRKVGNDAFVFPLGDTTLHDSIAYHPLGMSAPSATGDRFEAQYYATGQTLGATLADTLESISNCEYWRIERQNGSSDVTVKVYWNQNSCGIDNYDDLRLAGWLTSASEWIDLGVSDFNPGFPAGNLSTGAALSFATQLIWNVAIGKRPNFTPYATLKRQLDAGYYQCSNGKLMFRFQDEYNDPDAKLSFRIYNDQYGLITSDQMISSGSVPNVYYGSNYYLLNVLDCNVVPNGNLLNGFFILEVINEKGEFWYLRFKHTTALNPNCNGDVNAD
jgi:hypothetical protein